MMKKLIIFDLDGTLVDTRLDLFHSLNYALRKNNVEEVGIETVVSNLGHGLLYLVTNCCKQVSKIDKVFTDFKEHYSHHLLDYSTIYFDIDDVITALKNKGYLLAVLSNKKDEYTKLIVKHFFKNQFNFILGEIDTIKKKPSEESVNYILSNLNMDKNDAILIGDSIVDYQTSVNSNIDFIHASYGFLDKINEANVVIKKPKDILNIL